MLGFQGIFQTRAAEHFGRKVWNAGNFPLAAFAQRIAHAQRAVVGHTDHIAGIGFVCNIAIIGKEHHRGRHSQRLAAIGLQLHSAFELAGGQPHKRDPVTVVRVHVCLDLEHKPGDFLVAGLQRGSRPFDRGLGFRTRSHLGQSIDQFEHAKPAQRRPEINRRQMTFAIAFQIKLRKQLSRHLRAFGQLQHLFIRQFSADGVPPEGKALAGGELVVHGAAIGHKFVSLEISDTLETIARSHRPLHRGNVQRQLVLDVIEQFRRVQRLAVHLVDEGQDRNIAQAADLNQLQCARLHALCGIKDHNRAVSRGERAVGVFGEVFVTGRIEQVEGQTRVLIGHHRG